MTPIKQRLAEICRRHGVTSLYVFGSRSAEISARVQGLDSKPDFPNSDGDFAARFEGPISDPLFSIGGFIADLEDRFELSRADLAVLNTCDPFVALEAVRGELLYCVDLDDQAEEELFFLRRAGDLAVYEAERLEKFLSGEIRR